MHGLKQSLFISSVHIIFCVMNIQYIYTLYIWVCVLLFVCECIYVEHSWVERIARFVQVLIVLWILNAYHIPLWNPLWIESRCSSKSRLDHVLSFSHSLFDLQVISKCKTQGSEHQRKNEINIYCRRHNIGAYQQICIAYLV